MMHLYSALLCINNNNNNNLLHLYSAFLGPQSALHRREYCCTPKALHNHVCVCVCVCVGGGVSPQPPPVSSSIHLDDAMAATGQRRQCAHHTSVTDGEERES